MVRRNVPHDPSIGDRIKARRELRGWSIRFAASRAGIAHTTWSRIERGLLTADNRFTLAEIAGALECSVAELAGLPAASGDPAVAAAIAGVGAVREALIDVDLDEPPTCAERPLPELETTAATELALRSRCDYGGAIRLLPGLLRGLHAATHGPDRATALRLLTQAGHDAFICLGSVGYPAEGWLAARLCHQAAEAAEDPTLQGFAGYTLSRSAASAGSYGRALRLADRAADELDRHTDNPGALPTLGMLRLGGAYAQRALRGDAQRYLDEAAELAVRTGETDIGDSLYFGPTNCKVWQVSMDVDGGDPERAVALAATTDPQRLPVVARQSLFYIDLGRGLARLGRAREAGRMLLVAERMAPQRVRASRFVAETVRGLADKAGPDLRGLAERLGVAS